MGFSSVENKVFCGRWKAESLKTELIYHVNKKKQKKRLLLEKM